MALWTKALEYHHLPLSIAISKDSPPSGLGILLALNQQGEDKSQVTAFANKLFLVNGK